MTPETDGTYRRHFARPDKAEEYDRDVCGSDSYSGLTWELEKAHLATLIDELRRTHHHIDYLDFAAGTGRIISFVEDKVDTAVGIEISPAMIDVARERLSKGTMVCADITAADAAIEGQYDLITAFRFVLNAEPSLRLAGLKALAARLKDESSVLIFNNHGHLFSHKLLLYPYHKLRSLGRGDLLEGNYMTNRQARRLADQAGLRIERTLGSGLLSAKSTRFMSLARVRQLEKRLGQTRMLSPFGVNQMYVARLK